MYEDCDVALSLFNPYKFKVMDHMGYDIPKMVDNKTGANYFRSLKMIKNQGEDDIRWALAFNGAIGQFCDLPRISDMSEAVYEQVKSLQHFQTGATEQVHVSKPFAGFGRTHIDEQIKQAVTE